MDQTNHRLPATISAGMALKVREAFRQPIDGHPASQGLPMEAEVKHYYNYLLSQDEIDFDTFIGLLATDLSRAFPALQFDMTWVRQCDALNGVRIARRTVAKLRTYIHEQRHFTVSFWDMLWKLQSVSMHAHGITHTEAGTTPQEVSGLAWEALLREYRPYVRTLRTRLRLPETTSARNAFIRVDEILAGFPIPEVTFCANRQAHYSRGGPYRTYHEFANGRPIPPDAIGWSSTEHIRARELIFPEQQEDDGTPTDRFDPSAPATLGQSVIALPAERPDIVPFARSDGSESRALADPESWAKVVELAMRNLPHLSQTAIHPS